MTTLEQALSQQKTANVLLRPSVAPATASSGGSLTFSLCNQTSSNNVYAYVTGIATNNNYANYLLKSDGVTPYYPNNPTSTGTALSENCAIPLGKVGSTTDITVPFTDGGRVWFSIGDTLTFLLNPGESGAELVEPSVTNTSDPNYNLTWDFCEFSLGTAGLYVNITYVDFVCIPIALTLTNTSGTVTHVSGLPSDGLETICNELVAQNNKDNAGWDKLIVKKSDGSTLRVLNPTGGIDFDSTLFKDYWTDYVNQAWNKYVSASLEIDTQSSWGVVDGNTSNDRNSITFSGVGSFSKPSAADIFSQSTGAFAPQASNTDELLNIGARLSTAINRSTLLTDPDQPDAETVSSYYQNSVTNHFARIVHAANLDGKGYCFPYDDVGGANEEDQSGRLTDPSPSNLLITVGGGNASSKLKRGLVEAEKPKMKRSLAWNEDVKEPLPQAADYRDLEKAQVADYRDLEKGEHPKLMNELARANEAPKAIVPPILKRALGRYWTQFRSSSLYERLGPIIELINQFLISFLSLSLRAVLSRLAIILFVLIFYFLGMEPRGADIASQRRILEAAGLLSNGTITHGM